SHRSQTAARPFMIPTAIARSRLELERITRRPRSHPPCRPSPKLTPLAAGCHIRRSAMHPLRMDLTQLLSHPSARRARAVAHELEPEILAEQLRIVVIPAPSNHE